MTLTRLAFFKLLAAVGIGQAVPRDQLQCLQSNDGKELHFASCSCESDKENCPLGHCQKPRRINGTTSSLTIYAADEGAALGQVELHVCSVCWIVYVPTHSTFSK